MNEAETLFVALRQSADDDVVDMLERMVRDAPDHALNKDAPVTRQIQRIGSIKSQAILGGLHHHYARA